MRISREDDIKSKRNGTPHSCINAVLGHATGHDQTLNTAPMQYRFEVGAKKSIASNLANEKVGGRHAQFRAQCPAVGARLKGVSGASIVLNKDHWERGRM